MAVEHFIPIKSVVGPGSQVDDFAEGQLEYIDMPKGMETFHPPILPEPDEVEDIQGGIDVLEQAIVQLAQYNPQAQYPQLSLSHLSPGSLYLVNQLLGVGEVSVAVAGNVRTEIQEAVMAGLWRVRTFNDANIMISDALEVGAIPSAVTQVTFASANDVVDDNPADLPQGTINAPSMLVELKERGQEYQKGDQALVVNLSLLPLSEQDVMVLGERLGVGPVTILSRGYGNCRIGSTNCKNIWWIKYYNSEDALILNTIDVVEVPEVAMAAPEDIADSAIRLAEIVDIYR
jgi:hydrogenase-1 operon protein HyaF